MSEGGRGPVLSERTPLLGVVGRVDGSWYQEIEDNGFFAQFLGIGLAFLSGVLMTAYSSMLKLLVTMDTMQVAAMRGLLQALVMAIIVLVKGLDFRQARELKVAFILILVAVTGGLRLLFIFTSFARLPLGDSTTILFSSPIVVMTLSIFILHEHCGIFRFTAAVSLVTGVVLIAKPPLVFGTLFGTTMESYDLLGYSLVLGACFMSATGLVLTKLISKKVEKAVILFYIGLASAAAGLSGLLSVGKPSLSPPLWEWGLSLAICFLGLLQQYCLVWAVTLESPARVTIVRTMQIIFAYGVQVAMFQQMPVATDLIGAALVFFTVIAITFEKKITEWLSCSLC